MSIADDLISILGKDANSQEVINVVNSFALNDVYDDDPPFRRYVGSSLKGLDVLFENEKVLDIQFFVKKSESHMPFSNELPFGIKSDMNDVNIHTLLGNPEIRDSVGSKYTVLDGTATLTVVYDRSDGVSYLSIRKI